MIVYPRSMAKTVPVRELRANLSSLLDEVSGRRDHVLVTRNGVPAAALVPKKLGKPLPSKSDPKKVLSTPSAATKSGFSRVIALPSAPPLVLK